MRLQTVALLVGVIGLLLSGCRDGASRSDTIAGQWSAQDAWSVLEAWRIGGSAASQHEAFSGTRLDVALGPNGQVFVLDPQPREIRVFDRYGSYVRTIGRRGEGPGEFSSPASMAWDADEHLWVRDQRGRYIVFDSVGTLLAVHERPRGSIPTPSGAGVFDDSGNFVDEGVGRSPDGRSGIVLFRVSPNGEVVDSLPVMENPEFERRTTPAPSGGGLVHVEFSREMFDLFELYQPRLVYTPASGATIWMAESNNPRLIQRSFWGDTLRIVDGPSRGYVFDSEEERRIAGALALNRVDPGRYAFTRQTVQGLRELDDGHLLVAIEEVSGEPTSLLDVFTGEGVYLGELRLPFSVWISELDVRGDTLVSISRDELDAPFLVRAIIDRKRQ